MLQWDGASNPGHALTPALAGQHSQSRWPPPVLRGQGEQAQAEEQNATGAGQGRWAENKGAAPLSRSTGPLSPSPEGKRGAAAHGPRQEGAGVLWPQPLAVSPAQGR